MVCAGKKHYIPPITSKNLDFKLRILNLALMSNKSQNDWSTQIESDVEVKSRAKFQFFQNFIIYQIIYPGLLI